MSAVSGDIVNLINGVSQQAAALRQPTQAAEQVNFYSTIVDGLKKRPPTRVLAKILGAAPPEASFHIINRDAGERYIVVLTDGDLKVFDFAGAEKTVAFPDGKAYLSAAVTPSSDFHAVTVADYTFIANRRVVCRMDETQKSPARHREAIVNITAGNYARTYRIKINGSLVAEYATPDGSNSGHGPYIATTNIATELYNDLVANGFNDGVTWGTGIHQNALHIVRWDDQDFTIAVTDDVNGNASQLAKDMVQKFTALPNYGPHGFAIEVGNTEGTTLDNYWVWADKGGTDQNSRVVWRETVKPNTVIALDAATMPHLLVREADGTFTFKRAAWDERKCGDAVKIAPDPSFIGRTIEAITFFRNRLGFLSDESVVFSRSGSYFDFFRTTATTVLDDDPIDVTATHVKVSLLKHAIPHQDYLLLFSDQTQFRLAGNELLTPKTVSIRPLTEYGCSTRVSPIGVGPSIFFVADGADSAWATVYEYTIDKAAETADSDDITAHVPSYIPGGVFRVVGSPEENTVVALTTGRRDAMWVYRYYWAQNEKLQSSWSRWEFAGATLLECAFIDSDLYVLVQRSDGVFLELLDLDPAAYDEGFAFLVGLDQRVHSDDLPAPTFSAATNRTTYTLPYAVPSGVIMRAVVAPGGSGTVGAEATVYSAAGTQLVLRGDTRSRKLLIGHAYRSAYRFSTFFPRIQQANGGSVTRQDGRLQVGQMAVVYSNSAYFRAEVTADARETVVYPFSGVVLGNPNVAVGAINLASGRHSFPVLSRNDRVVIDLVNDTWLPSNFISASWRGVWNSKARQV